MIAWPPAVDTKQSHQLCFNHWRAKWNRFSDMLAIIYHRYSRQFLQRLHYQGSQWRWLFFTVMSAMSTVWFQKSVYEWQSLFEPVHDGRVRCFKKQRGTRLGFWSRGETSARLSNTRILSSTSLLGPSVVWLIFKFQVSKSLKNMNLIVTGFHDLVYTRRLNTPNYFWSFK